MAVVLQAAGYFPRQYNQATRARALLGGHAKRWGRVQIRSSGRFLPQIAVLLCSSVRYGNEEDFDSTLGSTRGVMSSRPCWSLTHRSHIR
jgi:hypothetical protein